MNCMASDWEREFIDVNITAPEYSSHESYAPLGDNE